VTIIRLFALLVVFVLLLRVLAVILPIIAPSTQRSIRRMVVSVDVVGGLIMLLLVGLMVYLGEPLSALLLAVLGIPLFIGAYRALPEWWWWPR
jgi:hypothetical protein